MMKKLLFSILCAFMVSTMASAQYLNVKLDDGTYRSFKTSAKTEVSFGEKKGAEVAESEQTVTVNGHKVTVKLAENTPANEVALRAYIEGDNVRIKAISVDGYGLECIKDNEVLTPDVSNGLQTFTVSNISKDMVVTIGYITVRFDLNNSNITDNFKDKPADITRIVNNSTVPRTYASAEKHSFRGWYKDKECTSPWNYSDDKVTKSITLYAKWAEDPTEDKINSHEFVKLGGYYWATENVGEVKDQNNENMYMLQGTYGYYYNQANAKVAANTWNSGSSSGHTWILPSEAQWQALIDCCDWEWQNGYEYNGKTMNGMLVKGRSDTYESGHSIFLPAAGFYVGGDSDVGGQGGSGYYWSADDGRYLEFGNGYRTVDYYNPNRGMAVRPVSE